MQAKLDSVQRQILEFYVTRITNNLNYSLKSDGFSQADMSRELGIDVKHIRKIRKGQIIPTLPTIIKICDYFGYSFPYFIDNDFAKADLADPESLGSAKAGSNDSGSESGGGPCNTATLCHGWQSPC